MSELAVRGGAGWGAGEVGGGTYTHNLIGGARYVWLHSHTEAIRMRQHSSQLRTSGVNPALIRRVRRVEDRMEDTDTADSVLDDVFVLFRALEAAVAADPAPNIRTRVRSAIEQAVDYHGLAGLVATRRWIDQLKYLEREPPDQLAEWFADDKDMRAASRERHIRDIERLREAAQAPSRWHTSDSRRLADVLYSMRCAVIHPSLNTANALALRILPALRRAVIELVIALATQDAGLTLEQGRALFAAAGRRPDA